MAKPLYETDFYSWTQQQAGLLRQGRLGELDFLKAHFQASARGILMMSWIVISGRNNYYTLCTFSP